LKRQLEVKGEVINNQVMLVQLILSKFPFEVVVKLEESKLPNERWNMEDLRKAISRYIRVQENVYCYAYNTKGQVQIQGDNNKDYNDAYQRSVYHPTNKGKGYQFQTQTTQAEVFASLSGRKDKIMRPCIFCNGDHYNDQCKTLASRKRKLNEEKWFYMFETWPCFEELPSPP